MAKGALQSIKKRIGGRAYQMRKSVARATARYDWMCQSGRVKRRACVLATERLLFCRKRQASVPPGKKDSFVRMGLLWFGSEKKRVAPVCK